MSEQLITFEIAKIANEKGFAKDFSPIRQYASETLTNGRKVEWDVTPDPSKTGKLNLIKRVSQSELATWIRNNHYLHIITIPTVTGYFAYKIIDIQMDPDNTIERPPYDDVSANDYVTHEEALEDALEEALKLI